jgi:hypothetical protein
MWQTLLMLFRVYLVSSLIGIAPFLILFPAFLRTPAATVALAPYTGLLLLSVTSVFSIHFNLPVITGLWLAVGLSLLSVVIRPREAHERFRYLLSSFGRSLFGGAIYWTGAGLMGLFFLLPVLAQQYPSSPQFNGFDQAGYAQSALFLYEGGTLEMSQAAIESEVQAESARESLEKNLESINFNAYVNSDFLNKMYRIGYPAIVSLVTTIAGARHPYDILYLTLFFSYLALIAFYCAFFSHLYGWGRGATLCSAAAIAFNYNILNVAYMGMLAQFFATPLIFGILGCICLMREEQEPSMRSECFALLSLLLASIFPIFPEGFFFIIPFAIFLVITDNFERRQLLYIPKWASLFGLSVVFAGVMVFPQSARWVWTTVDRLAYIKTSGFWQPVWACPSEIIGWWTVYSGAFYQLHARTGAQFAAGVILSTLILIFLLWFYFKKIHDSCLRVLAALIVFVVLIFIKTVFVERINNYQYTKAFTLALPMLVFVFANMVLSWRLTLERGRLVASGLLLFGLGGIFLSGASYLWDAARRSTWLGLPDYDLGSPELTQQLKKMTLVQLGCGGSAYWYVPLMHFNWLNETPVKRKEPHLKDEVGLMLPRSLVADPLRLQLAKPESIVFLNQRIVIVRTGVDLERALQLGRVDAFFDLSLLGNSK